MVKKPLIRPYFSASTLGVGGVIKDVSVFGNLGHFNHSPCFCHRQFLHLVTYLSFSLVSSKGGLFTSFDVSFCMGSMIGTSSRNISYTKTLAFKGIF